MSNSLSPRNFQMVGLQARIFRCVIFVCAAQASIASRSDASDGPQSAQLDRRSRPNIIFLCTDDQAQWAVGAYGNREIKTPNMDRLAARGAIFRNAFTITPVCSPSRAALMTSRYPSELGIADWIDPRKEPDVGLAPAAVTWPELLKGFGYSTMLAGKWHLGTRDEFHPTRQGFDRFFGFRDGSNQPIDPRLEVDGQVRQLKGSLPDLLVDEGLRFIDAPPPGALPPVAFTSARRTRLTVPCPRQIQRLTARSTRRSLTCPGFRVSASSSSIANTTPASARSTATWADCSRSLTNGGSANERS